MYPAYPSLAINAAISMHIILTFVGTASRTSLMGKIPAKLRLLASTAGVMLAVGFSVLRTLGTSTAYYAPLVIHRSLAKEPDMTNGTVSYGKEWYRFPSSYFLPQGAHAKFIQSEFSGLLPGEFPELGHAQLFPISETSKVPSGMNDENKADPDKYVGC